MSVCGSDLLSPPLLVVLCRSFYARPCIELLVPAMREVVCPQPSCKKYTRASCSDTDGLLARQLLAVAEQHGMDGVYFSEKGFRNLHDEVILCAIAQMRAKVKVFKCDSKWQPVVNMALDADNPKEALIQLEQESSQPKRAKLKAISKVSALKICAHRLSSEFQLQFAIGGFLVLRSHKTYITSAAPVTPSAILS